MTTLDLATWKHSRLAQVLAEDAQKLAGLLEQGNASPAAQRGAASALNYLSSPST